MLKPENFKLSEEFRFLNIDNLADSDAVDYSTLYQLPVAYFD